MSGNPDVSFKPFDNESQCLQINGLTIENRFDQVSIYGSLDLSLDQEGLRKAEALKSVLDSVLAQMKLVDLPEHIKAKGVKTGRNPLLKHTGYPK